LAKLIDAVIEPRSPEPTVVKLGEYAFDRVVAKHPLIWSPEGIAGRRDLQAAGLDTVPVGNGCHGSCWPIAQEAEGRGPVVLEGVPSLCVLSLPWRV